MAIIDFLIGAGGIDKQRDQAIRFAKERFDPMDFAPQVDFARDLATEGVPQGQEDVARTRTVEQLFRPTDFDLYGGNQARAIAGASAQNRQSQQAMGQFEGRLTEADIQAKQQGRQAFAESRSRQLQTASQRDAAIEEARMQAEAEKDRRKKQLGQAVGQMAGTVAGSFLGPAGAAGAGALIGGLTGGGGGAVAGGVSGATTAMQMQMLDKLAGAEEGGEKTVETLLDAGSDAGLGVRDLTKTVPENVSGVAPRRGLTGKVGELPPATPQPTGGQQKQMLSEIAQQDTGAPQQQFDLTQLLGTPDYLKPLNFEGDGQQVRKPRQRWGDQLFGGAQEAVDRNLGVLGVPFRLGTFGIRQGLNVADMFGEEYSKALEQGPPLSEPESMMQGELNPLGKAFQSINPFR